ncbi:response regulator transcription factor [Actinoplanes sp. NEAU-A11]|uniref:Response regulator transcription factor n=2 Tax=Actinoplanes aureus TaxID=2792083 RepID=A0A931CGB2_9ACTN|nr:response regulator transcription factor [Actinoplanes aureus]
MGGSVRDLARILAGGPGVREEDRAQVPGRAASGPALRLGSARILTTGVSMRVVAWLLSPRFRRRLLIAAVLTGCFLWAMVIIGLSFGMVDHGGEQWWVIPLFGAFVLAVAVLAVRRIPAPPAGALAPAATRRLADQLSARELEVLHHLAAGRSNAEIARALFVAPGTVKAHLNHIFRKLEAASRLQAVAHAREAGLLD